MSQQPAHELGALEFDLADRLRKSLRVAKVSVQEMADELLVERNTIGRYINGHTVPPRRKLIAWALKTGVPLEWLESGHVADRAPGGGTLFVAVDEVVPQARVELATFRLGGGCSIH